MARPARSLPHELSPAWPDAPSGDPIAEVARRFALNVRSAMGERSIRSVAADCGLNHATVITVLEGRSWPDLVTIAKLEAGLDTGLWPGR